MGFKVLQLGKYYTEKGGIETVTQLLVDSLQCDNTIDVLCFSKKNKNEIRQTGQSTIWECASFFFLFSTSISFSFFSRFRKIRNNYDIILLHAPNPLAAIALWLFPTRAKVVIQWHGDILNKGFLYTLFRFFERKMVLKAEKILATSDIYARESEVLKTVAYKTEVVPLGIDENNLQSTAASVKAIKSQFKNKKIVFSLGRFVYFKGFEYLIKSALELDNDIVILIGGFGPLNSKYQKLIVDNNLEKKVFIIPEDNKVCWGNYYSACDVFCLPSIEKAESFGLVLLEAMSFSKPIVATNIPGSGTPWVNENNVTGYNVTPKNSKELVGAIHKVLHSGNLSTMSKNSRLRFEQNFTHKQMVNNILLIFQRLLQVQPVNALNHENVLKMKAVTSV